MKTSAKMFCCLTLCAFIIAPSLVRAQKQWWNPTQHSDWIELSATHGVTPPGFLDDEKRVSLEKLTASKTVKSAILTGGLNSLSRPSAPKLQAALEIVEEAANSGEVSLVLSTLKIQILAVLGRDPEKEILHVLAKYKKRASPYLAYELALCEKWLKFRSNNRDSRDFSINPLYTWSSWLPSSEREKSVHSLLSFATGISVGKTRLAPLNAAEEIGAPELFEWLYFRYSMSFIDIKTGQSRGAADRLPYPFKTPSTEVLHQFLSQCSDKYPKRYLAALCAFRLSRTLGMTKEALMYARRYLANAPDHSLSKQEARDFIAKNG